jgi:hypothetical protein
MIRVKQKRERLQGHLFGGRDMKLPNTPGLARWRAGVEILDEDLTGLEQGLGCLLALGTRIDYRNKAFYLNSFASRYFSWATMIGVRRLHRGGSEPFNITFVKLTSEMRAGADKLASEVSPLALALWLGVDVGTPDLVPLLQAAIDEERKQLDELCKPISDFADGIAHVIPVADGMGVVKLRPLKAALAELRRLCNRLGTLLGVNVPKHEEALDRYLEAVEAEFDALFGA